MRKQLFVGSGVILFVVFMMGAILSGCEEVGKIKAVNFDTDLNFTIPVTELNSGTNMAYSESMVLDASTNPEIKKYINSIQSIEVQSMEFAIEDYTTIIGDEIYLNSGVFGFGDKTSTTPQSSCNVDALPITHWADTGYFDFDSCNSTLNAIGVALTNDQAVKMFINGILTKTPVSFNLKVRMKVKVVAKV